ncbi:MAG: hypothetical protein DWG76_06350 [Chloroflexi bacterium]|nr:hypothetical protein [Chloroflexota bacterium]
MYPYSFAREKIGGAIYYLAIGEGDVRSRLWSAYMEFHPLSEKDFPDGLRKDYRWIMKELTKRDDFHLVIKATVKQ